MVAIAGKQRIVQIENSETHTMRLKRYNKVCIGATQAFKQSREWSKFRGEKIRFIIMGQGNETVRRL